MEIRVFVLPGGKLQVFVDGNVSFADAQAMTMQMLARLHAQGIPADMIGTIEQHKDGVTHVHQITQEHRHEH